MPSFKLIDQATNIWPIALFIWLAVLSFYLLRTVGHYRKIVKGAKEQNLEKILENIVDKLGLQSGQIEKIAKEIEKITVTQKKHIQKYALIRFNPFEDTGGDQSFVVALLDAENNGVVISSLHSRGGTRVYAKGVTDAKPTAHPFSKEEKEVVEKAARQV